MRFSQDYLSQMPCVFPFYTSTLKRGKFHTNTLYGSGVKLSLLTQEHMTLFMPMVFSVYTRTSKYSYFCEWVSRFLKFGYDLIL